MVENQRTKHRRRQCQWWWQVLVDSQAWGGHSGVGLLAGGRPEAYHRLSKEAVALGVWNSKNMEENPRKMGWWLLGLVVHHLDLAMWRDLVSNNLWAQWVHLRYKIGKLGLMPTKVESDSRLKSDFMNINRGKDAKWASKLWNQSEEDLWVKSNWAQSGKLVAQKSLRCIQKRYLTKPKHILNAATT